MPYVVKHAGGQTPYWYAVYRDETGKRRKRSTKLTSKSKALELAHALQRAANEARRGALTEARTRELLSEILQSVNGEGLRCFTVQQWLELFVNQKQKSRANGTFQRQWSLGWVATVDREGRTIWIVDAHGYGKHFIVRAEKILSAFLELERAIHQFAVDLVV